jgi:ribosomal protein S13
MSAYSITIAETVETTMARQGRAFTQDEIQRIIWLLSNTDMTVKQISERMNCSGSAVASINRRAKIRDYSGRRMSWDAVKMRND